MITISPREKRTIRYATIGISVYLLLFYGIQLVNKMERSRNEYRQLETDIQRMQYDFETYQEKLAKLDKLTRELRVKPSQQSKNSLAAEASSAIQKLALGKGIQPGPIRETPPRPSNKELATIQLESVGPIPAVLQMLNDLHQLGYPLIIDTVQISVDPTKPGMVKANLTIILLDFEQWKKEERRNA